MLPRPSGSAHDKRMRYNMCTEQDSKDESPSGTDKIKLSNPKLTFKLNMNE